MWQSVPCFGTIISERALIFGRFCSCHSKKVFVSSFIFEFIEEVGRRQAMCTFEDLEANLVLSLGIQSWPIEYNMDLTLLNLTTFNYAGSAGLFMSGAQGGCLPCFSKSLSKNSNPFLSTCVFRFFIVFSYSK